MLIRSSILCQDLTTGDVCLPPNHPEAVRTPDLCDRFKKFEFNSHDVDQFSPKFSGAPLRHGIASLLPSVRGPGGGGSMMSPPMSPAKKNVKDPDKPKRPMNGFMLFAKKFRLELIQQHPGKDNRAISVLLGESWKSLAVEDREHYSHKAKVMADEQKKLYPDCWKRKRSLTTANQNTNTNNSQSHAPNSVLHHVPPSPTLISAHHPSMSPHTPTRLAHPFSFLHAHPSLASLGITTSQHAALGLISTMPHLEGGLHNPR